MLGLTERVAEPLPARAQYFRDVDDALERAEEAHVAMEEAVVGEQYAEAARLRSELGALEDRDSLGRVLRARRPRNRKLFSRDRLRWLDCACLTCTARKSLP